MQVWSHIMLQVRCICNVVRCLCVFSDLTLSFMNPRLLDDVSFHPCVRYKRWEVSTLFLLHFIYTHITLLSLLLCYTLYIHVFTCMCMCCSQKECCHSFLLTGPSDYYPTKSVAKGSVCVCQCVCQQAIPLLSLSRSNVALPVYVTPQFSFSDGTGKFEIKVGPKQTMGKVVCAVLVYTHDRALTCVCVCVV